MVSILSRYGFYTVALWFLVCGAMVSLLWRYGSYTVALWLNTVGYGFHTVALWFLYCCAMVPILLRYGFFTVALWFLLAFHSSTFCDVPISTQLTAKAQIKLN